jgi:alcohol dehydrogenase
VKADALVLKEPRRFVRRQFDVPEIGADDGLLRVEACGLCGTDHEQYTGHIPLSGALIPGHEVVGVVEQAGPRAAERWGVRPGDRVAVEVFQSCRSCASCRAGEYRRCERNGLATMVGFVGVSRPPGLWGGYATHLYLGPDSMLLPVPAGLDPVVATLFNPLGAGIRWAADLPALRPGQVVAVLGPGVRGLFSCAAAKEAGASFVMVTGVGPSDAGRLAVASRFGADLAVDVAVDDPGRALRAATGGLADVVVDVTAKAPAAFAQALALARPGGTVVVAGTRGRGDVPGFNPDHIVYKELRVLGALGVDVRAYRPALDLLASGRFPFAELPREVVGLAGLEALLQRMAGEGSRPPPVHAVFSPSADPTSGGAS